MRSHRSHRYYRLALLPLSDAGARYPPKDWPSEIPLPPFDDANARLLRNVAPKGWLAPVPKDRYHLVVIGAGTAGLVSAAIAAGLGARVALIERHMFGGDCLNFGCVPSKDVIRAARAWHDARTAAARFGAPPTSGDGDFPAVMERLRRLRADISRVDSVERFRSLGIDVFLGDARFTAPDVITVNDTALRFRRAIIATGARAARPEIPGLADTPYDTNESIFSLTERPARLMVIGGGPIGGARAVLCAIRQQRDDRTYRCTPVAEGRCRRGRGGHGGARGRWRASGESGENRARVARRTPVHAAPRWRQRTTHRAGGSAPRGHGTHAEYRRTGTRRRGCDRDEARHHG